MKSAVETLSPTKVKLTIEVPFEELQPSLDAAYKRIAKQVNVPGFRKGKVPPAIIDRQFGRGVVLDEAINEALPRVYTEALRENDLDPLAQPEIDVTKLEDGELLEFTAEVNVRPQIELPPYDGLEAEVEDFPVTDEDVTEQLDALRRRFGALKDVDRAAAEDDFVTIDLSASKDGEAVENAAVSGMSYQVGRGGMVQGLDEALVGLSAGESTTFASTLLAGDAAGEEVEIAVTVGAVKEQELPELDDEFAQMASEFDTVEELTEDVRTRLGRGKRLEQAAAARDAVLDKLLEQIEVPLPDELVESEITAQRENLERQLEWAGMSLQDYLDEQKQTEDELAADIERRVRDGIAAQFVLDAIAKKEEFGVEQDELMNEMLRRASQRGEDPNEFIKHMFEHNHIPEIVSDIVRGKAMASVVESATVKDPSGEVIRLKGLLPDGTYAEDAPEQDAAEDAPERDADEA